MKEAKAPLGSTEIEILRYLGDQAPLSVGDVAAHFAETSGQARTTILTMMRILRAKGYLSCRKSGRAHIFTSKVNRETAARKAVRQVLTKFFAGSPGELVLSFLREEEVSPEELDALKKRIREAAGTEDER